MNENDINTLIGAMKEVFPTAEMIKRSVDHMDEQFAVVEERFDRIENILLTDHRRRIEKLEAEVKELRDALAI